MQNLSILIPSERLHTVEKALEKTFHATVEEVTMLTGGLSASPVFKILINGKYYVLKLDTPLPSIYNEQVCCMEIAADAGVAPPVFYLNREEGITITGFIESKPLHHVFKSTDTLLPQLAKTIRSIHELPLFPAESSLLESVDGFIGQFKASDMLKGPVFDACFEYYEVIKRHYPWYDTDKVSSHNDLNPNNMVFDGGKIWIIDWDAAFKNDRYVDLAVMANFYVSSDEQEELFLTGYFGNELNDAHRARFFVMRQICRLVYAMLMFKLADHSKPEAKYHDFDMEKANLMSIKEQLGNGQISLSTYDGQLLFGKALMNEALKSMRLPRFMLSIAQLRMD